MAIGGRAFSQMVEGEKLYDIVLRLPLELRDDPNVIGRIPIDTPPAADGPARASAIPLVAAGDDQPAQAGGVVHLPREQPPVTSRSSSASANRDLASAIAEAQQKVDDPKTGAKLPEGYEIEWSGEFAQMQEANARLMWIVPLSITLIMVLLYTAFNSLKDALLVMANVVAATMGGVWALRLTGTPFSISAAVGFISIFGVAVQNGVLLISYFNQMRRRGHPGPRGGDARGRAAAPAGRHDLADGRPRAPARGAGQLDRLAGAEAAGDRRRRRDARDPRS